MENAASADDEVLQPGQLVSRAHASNFECGEGVHPRVLLDASGNPLCHSALWDMRCPRIRRFGICQYSHEVPEPIRIEFDKRKEEKGRAKRQANAERVRTWNLPPPPPAAVPDTVNAKRAEIVFEYDTGAHQLADLISHVLECASEEPLSKLHLRTILPDDPPLCPTLHHAFRLAGRKVPKSWRAVMGTGRNRRIIARLVASEPYKRWLKGYDNWVRTVILPLIGESFYYQRPPTLRIAMPSHAATIGVHRDADYHGHHRGEINFWCPLVDVHDSNTLWLESAPGKGDFAPRQLRAGSCLRFNGYLCRHYTQPNQTSNTRVSFDLRCIPLSAMDLEEEPPTVIGDYACAFMDAAASQGASALAKPSPARGIDLEGAMSSCCVGAGS
eukprot:6185696-Pleurochrysis_carterae.AAC.5